MRWAVVTCIALALTGGTGSAAYTGCPSANARVPKSLARRIAKQVIKEVYPDEPEAHARDIEEMGEELSSLFCARKYDLDGDGRAELLIQTFGILGCGTANTRVWVYRRGGRGYKQLLAECSVAPVIVLRHSTNGHRDLRVVVVSGPDLEIVTHRFDGKQYRAAECFTQEYVFDKRGRGRGKSKRHRCYENAVECWRPIWQLQVMSTLVRSGAIS
jgi:hypothetical protein